MWPTVKRLALGVVLIVLVSGVLLASDSGQRRSNADRVRHKWKVDLLEYVNVLDVEEAEAVMRVGLRDAGLVEGRDFEFHVRNAQGDMATLSTMVDAALSSGADLLLTTSTPTLQA